MARFAEFFAGIGLVREALEPLGWECVFANDIAEEKAVMYRARFGGEHLLVDDINALTLNHLPNDLDLLTASFPCIDLSLAGNRRGLAGLHSGTVWPFLNLASDLVQERESPKALLLENVTGFLTSHGGRDLYEVCERMGQLGYLIDLVVVDARWFTPQSRPRLFVIALREDLVPAALPPTDEVTRLRNRAVRRFQAERRELPLIELDLPEPPQRSASTLEQELDDLPEDDESWWPHERVKAIVEAMHPRHRERVEELTGGRRDGVATMFRRVRGGRTVGEVRGDRIAGCLRTPQGGSSVQFLVDCRSGDVRIRPLSGREYARLQGASSFPIQVGRRQAQLGFGDAICVPAVSWLANRALGHLLDQNRTPREVRARFAERERHPSFAAGS